jgi:hypothetical protein
VHSLSRRLLVSVSVPLALFFGVMMLALYALAEVRRARKSTDRSAAMFDRSAAYN